MDEEWKGFGDSGRLLPQTMTNHREKQERDEWGTEILLTQAPMSQKRDTGYPDLGG
jgi:hypothetical protein